MTALLHKHLQVHFKLDFFMKANNMNPDQTGSSLIWVYIVCKIGYLKEHKLIKEQAKG